MREMETKLAAKVSETLVNREKGRTRATRLGTIPEAKEREDDVDGDDESELLLPVTSVVHSLT